MTVQCKAARTRPTSSTTLRPTPTTAAARLRSSYGCTDPAFMPRTTPRPTPTTAAVRHARGRRAARTTAYAEYDCGGQHRRRQLRHAGWERLHGLRLTSSTTPRPNAADDGSCAPRSWFRTACTDPAYAEYDAAANADDGSCATLLGARPAYLDTTLQPKGRRRQLRHARGRGLHETRPHRVHAAANTDDGSLLHAWSRLHGLCLPRIQCCHHADDWQLAPRCGEAARTAYLEYTVPERRRQCPTRWSKAARTSAYLEYNAVTADGGSLPSKAARTQAYLEYNGSAKRTTAVAHAVSGCTDSAYLEYDGSANTDDGSCATLCEGCTDSATSIQARPTPTTAAALRC